MTKNNPLAAHQERLHGALEDWADRRGVSDTALRESLRHELKQWIETSPNKLYTTAHPADDEADASLCIHYSANRPLFWMMTYDSRSRDAS